MIIANYQSLPGEYISDLDLTEHAKYLSSFESEKVGVVGFRTPPEGFESYICVDVFGKEFVWMNEAFPREKFNWYLWFESVFVVPEEMATFLQLRWT